MRGRSFKGLMRGVTLIELVVAITVLAIALTSIIGFLSSIAARSADTLVREQAVAIASSYLNEVLAKSFVSTGAAPRVNFTGVTDYNGLLDNGAHEQTGAAMANLTAFTVAVAVVPGVLGAVPANEVVRVDVTVNHPSGVVVLLSGYRTLYP
jgi:MSHA pilin protein MshD